MEKWGCYSTPSPPGPDAYVSVHPCIHEHLMTQYFTWSVAGWLQVSFSIATEVYVPCSYHRLMYVRAPIQNPQLVHIYTAASYDCSTRVECDYRLLSSSTQRWQQPMSKS